MQVVGGVSKAILSSILEIAPVLLLVLDRAGPELDRTGAGSLFAFLRCPCIKADNVETVKP